MAVYAVYVVNRAGGLIYQYDNNLPRTDIEKTFSYPIELVLKTQNDKVVVVFGQRDGIKVGHTVIAVNGETVSGTRLEDGQEVLDIIGNEANYPISIKFGRRKLRTNEKIMLASMFHSLFAIGHQLSPEVQSSGIEVLETDGFKLHCYQTLTGVKFIVLADPKAPAVDSLLKKIHEIYADYALKNPFYSIDMPIRCELFDLNLQGSLEQAERTGITNV